MSCDIGLGNVGHSQQLIETETESFICPFSQHWLMRTDLCSCLGYLLNGCEAMADSLLVFMPHEQIQRALLALMAIWLNWWTHCGHGQQRNEIDSAENLFHNHHQSSRSRRVVLTLSALTEAILHTSILTIYQHLNHAEHFARMLLALSLKSHKLC